MTSRRNFLGILGTGAALPALAPFPSNDSLRPISAEYDMSWVDRCTVPHRFVFDVPEVSDGGGLWRMVLLREEYNQVYGTWPDQIAAVLVLRHFGIAMAMQHTFWADGKMGEMTKTRQRGDTWATRNPIGPAAEDARPGSIKYTLPHFIESGGIVLGCDLAFNNMAVSRYKTEENTREEARELALADLIPGVILQPSGFFAVVRAQQAGCALFCND